jgi:precorrin-4/cobalt-precorrin-4 C11-methyltransferase
MTVYFIGAGPGAPDLITVRGADILRRVPLVMYAGSLMPKEILCYCRADATLVNTAEINLEEQVAYFKEAKEKSWDVARLHSGDPSIYGATAEQMRRLKQLGIDYEIVPGVSSFSAAAATIGAELTCPEVSQTIILTRVSGRASEVPEAESLASLAAHRCTLCIFLSGPHLKRVVDQLMEHYPADTPIALVYRASWTDERRHRSTLGAVVSEVDVKDWALTTMMLVGPALDGDHRTESQLYSSKYTHRFRAAASV